MIRTVQVALTRPLTFIVMAVLIFGIGVMAIAHADRHLAAH